jgi:hypothetical protein
VLALARALLGLIRPLHRMRAVPRSALAFEAPHIRTAGVPPACARGSMARLALRRILPAPRGVGQTSDSVAGGSISRVARTISTVRVGFIARPFGALL